MDLSRLLPLHGNCGNWVNVAEYLPQPYEMCCQHLAVPPCTVSLRIILTPEDIRPIHLLDCLIHNLYKATVNLQCLRYFEVVTEELNFTRAAERLHVVHSLLSYHLRQLKDEPEGGERLTALLEAGSQARLLARAVPGTPDIDS
jgi:Bacterial regulatory helix-turn-helix protein, lysR family